MIVKQTENSIHEQITSEDIPKSPIYRASIYSGKPFYKDDYNDKKEQWKNSDSTSIIDNKTELVYDKLPIEVTIFKNEKIGYQIRCKKTGSIKRVTLIKINDVDLAKTDMGKIDLLKSYKFVPEFDVSELGVRLWKNIEKGGPSSFEWLIEDDRIGDLKFREEPEAFDSETHEKVSIDVSKTTLNRTSYLFKENLKSALESSKEGLKVDTDFYSSQSYVVSGTHAVYATARTTSTSFSDTHLYVGQYSSGGYSVQRGFLKFDTSSIPDSGILTSATIGLTIYDDGSDTDFDVDIIKQDWSSQDPITDGNRETAFDNCLSGTKDVTWRNTSGASTDTRYTSPSLDTTQISKTGATYYSMRSSRDYAGTTPTGNEYVDLYPYSASSSYRPLLTVDYYFSCGIIII